MTMTKASTYYFAVLAVLNALVACVTPRLDGLMVRVYREALEGKCLPVLTNLVVGWPWWPHVCCFLCLAGCAVSISTKVRSSALSHAIILALAVEFVWAFLLMLGYILPFLSILPMDAQITR